MAALIPSPNGAVSPRDLNWVVMICFIVLVWQAKCFASALIDQRLFELVCKSCRRPCGSFHAKIDEITRTTMEFRVFFFGSLQCSLNQLLPPYLRFFLPIYLQQPMIFLWFSRRWVFSGFCVRDQKGVEMVPVVFIIIVVEEMWTTQRKRTSLKSGNWSF